MSEKDKKNLENLSNIIGSWNDEQKGYLFGYLEGVATANKSKPKKSKKSTVK